MNKKENDGYFWNKIRAAERFIEANIGNACCCSVLFSFRIYSLHGIFRKICYRNILHYLYEDSALHRVALPHLDVLRQ